jgi:serine/threonine protein kinase
MKKHKLIDELKNTHYLKLLEISEDEKKTIMHLFNDNKLNDNDLDHMFILKDNIYKLANKNEVTDEDDVNNLYKIDILGQGGQGVVYSTRDTDTVIKIALENEQLIKDKKKIEDFHKKVKKLIYKPIPLDINIAKPLSVLENEAGYVMHLLSGMEPFSKLFPSELSKEEAEQMKIPEFLKDLYEKDKRSAFYFTHYLNTGGLRKRLYSLSRVAIVLMRLHSRGLVYSDLSHNNIFINNDEIPLVYLIDADNIEYDKTNRSIVYTPDYEVPEVVKDESNSLYSDIYSFAILSFMTLTTTHPFKGQGIEEADWDSEEIEKKEQWELPWIEDSNDDSNKSNAGLRASLTITKELDSLFHKVFEEGKEDKYKRPTLPLWIESLEKAATKTIKCNNCSMSYYDDIFDACPYCNNKKPQRIIAKSYYYKNGQKLNEKWYFVKEIDIHNVKKIEFPSYLFKSFDILNLNDVFLDINFMRRNKLEFNFHKKDENITFDSRLMFTTRKPSQVSKLRQGISIIVENNEDITTLIEIEIKE